MSDAASPSSLNFGQLEAPARPAAPAKTRRVLIMGDFSGRVVGDAPDEWSTPRAVSMDNFEDVLGQFAPKLSLQVGQANAVIEVECGSLDDFHPDELYQKLPVFAQLRSLRSRLAAAKTFPQALAELKLPDSPSAAAPPSLRRRGLSIGAALPTKARAGDFAGLLETRAARRPAAGAVDMLIREAIASFVTPAVDKEKQKMALAAADAAIADVMAAILHHPDWQLVESQWRGLDWLLRRMDSSIAVDLWDVSAPEVAADLANPELGASRIHKQLTAGKRGPYSHVLGLYEFDLAAPQIELLGRLATLADGTGCTYLGAVRPDVALRKDREWPDDLKEMWNALRAHPASRALALATPRFVLRLPYGARNEPIESFKFEEFSLKSGLGSLLWGSGAWLLAAALMDERGRSERIPDVAYFTFRDEEDEVVALPCTERALKNADADRLVSRGLCAAVSERGQPVIRLAGLRTVDGSELGAGPVAKKPAPRVGVGSVGLVSGKVPSRPAKPAPAEEASATSEESVSSDSDSSFDASTSADSSLDAGTDLGADSSGTDVSAETPSDDSFSTDSVSTDDASASSDASAEMDPELAALLKSLE